MKYRSRTDIISMILTSAMNGGATKTRLMYNAYLSYAQLKEYLQFLQEKGLLAYEPGTQLYKLTEKSLRFLSTFEEMRSMITLDDTVSTPVEKVELPVAKPPTPKYQY